MRHKKSWFALISIVSLLTVSCFRFSYEVQLSGPVELNSQWIELAPATPLKAGRDLQAVMLDLEPPFKYDYYQQGRGSERGQGILMPNGEVVNPQIQVIDQFGNTFELVYAGADDLSPRYSVANTGKFPTDRVYTKVRIRSSQPIKCKRIYWFCDSTLDWK